jgi:hypothetical protein
MLLVVHRILSQDARCIRSNSHAQPIVRGIKVSLRGNRCHPVRNLEVLDFRPNGNDLRGGVGTGDAMVFDGNGVSAIQHSDFAIVERDGVDLDNNIVRAKV